jgi:hypothetical protein
MGACPGVHDLFFLAFEKESADHDAYGVCHDAQQIQFFPIGDFVEFCVVDGVDAKVGVESIKRQFV